MSLKLDKMNMQLNNSETVEATMKKIVRYKTVTRVNRKTAVGKAYYPRIEVSGTELADAGFEYGQKIKVEIEKGRVIFTIE